MQWQLGLLCLLAFGSQEIGTLASGSGSKAADISLTAKWPATPILAEAVMFLVWLDPLCYFVPIVLFSPACGHVYLQHLFPLWLCPV